MKAYDAYYHANAKGTGSAAKFELHPAHDATAGAVFATFAQQIKDHVIPTSFPRFDWNNALKVKFDRADLSQILQVLRGFRESVNEGKGLFHVSTNANILIKFSHEIEPTPGYQFEISRKDRKSGETTSIVFRFSFDEAFTFMLALERALLFVCFGIPEVERAEKAENHT